MNFFFHQGALGDWIITWPILSALRPAWAVTAGSKAKLASRLFDEIEPCDIEQVDFSLLHTVGGAAMVSAHWRRVLGASETIVSFVSGGQDTWASNVRALAPAAKLGFVSPLPPADWDRHAQDWHLHQLRKQGFKLRSKAWTQETSRDCAAVPDLTSPRKSVVAAAPTQAGLRTIVHPGSGGQAKCWPAVRFDQLVRHLRQSGATVRVVLGEVEKQKWPLEQVEYWVKQHGAQIVIDLQQLYDLIANVQLYIGNDCGPTHLAAFMGVRTIALFGPSSPQTWAPRGPNVTIIAPPKPTAMSWLDPKTVLAACAGDG